LHKKAILSLKDVLHAEQQEKLTVQEAAVVRAAAEADMAVQDRNIMWFAAGADVKQRFLLNQKAIDLYIALIVTGVRRYFGGKIVLSGLN
jgi:hypothetical protein